MISQKCGSSSHQSPCAAAAPVQHDFDSLPFLGSTAALQSVVLQNLLARVMMALGSECRSGDRTWHSILQGDRMRT